MLDKLKASRNLQESARAAARAGARAGDGGGNSAPWRPGRNESPWQTPSRRQACPPYREHPRRGADRDRRPGRSQVRPSRAARGPGAGRPLRTGRGAYVLHGGSSTWLPREARQGNMRGFDAARFRNSARFKVAMTSSVASSFTRIMMQPPRARAGELRADKRRGSRPRNPP